MTQYQIRELVGHDMKMVADGFDTIEAAKAHIDGMEEWTYTFFEHDPDGHDAADMFAAVRNTGRIFAIEHYANF